MAPNHKYRQSFENHNAVSLIFYRRTVSGEHSCLIWSYGERRGEERPPPVLLICNTVIGKWNYHQWPVDDQIRQISVSGSRQVWKTSWPGTNWLTDWPWPGPAHYYTGVCGWNLSKLKVLLQSSSLIQYLLCTYYIISKTTYIWYRCYNKLNH